MAMLERQLAEFAHGLTLDQVPPEAQRVVQRMVMAVIGTGMAGAAEDGVVALLDLLREAGGAPQATTLIYGHKLPAAAAAQFNATLCRALDFCDAMAPGPHIGAALFPAALAAAELAGGCSGETFMAALVAGAEISSRMNLSEAQYDGFDPTGIAVVFSATAAASRILGLTAAQTHQALALAFNRCGGSFQSHVDGSLGVRIVQGWVAQAGVQCAQMAQRGITGPSQFLSGHYGYGHLYGRDTLDLSAVVADLGREWRLHRVVFKKYPSCGVTQGVTELTLALIQSHGLRAEDVAVAEVRLPPYAHRLVGHDFKVGDNPRVDAQFSAAYCVANALVRGASRLQHFSPAEVNDSQVQALARQIRVVADAALDARGHTAVDLTITTRAGQRLHQALDIAPGFPGADLTDAQHLARFEDCLAYAPHPPTRKQIDVLLGQLPQLHRVRDVTELTQCLMTI
jgi:2-methylcitrate dehydratase PrpD